MADAAADADAVAEPDAEPDAVADAEPDAEPDADADASADGDAGPGPDELPSYTVQLTRTRTLAVTGQVVAFEAGAAWGEPEGEVAWAWDLGEGTEEAAPSATSREVSWATPGDYAVTVTGTDEAGAAYSSSAMIRVYPADATFAVGDVDGDGALSPDDTKRVDRALQGLEPLAYTETNDADVDLDGDVTAADLELMLDARAQGRAAPTVVEPTSGSRGRVVRMIHPALLDPASEVSVQFGEEAPQRPVRGRPGYATTYVPLTLETPQSLQLTLTVDGEVAASVEFEVLAPATPSAQPGARVVTAMELLSQLGTVVTAQTAEYLALVEGLTDDDKAALQGIANMASEELTAASLDFLAAFELLDGESRALFEELALANDLDEAVAELEGALSTISAPISTAAGEGVVDFICSAKKVAEISGKIAKINTAVSGILDVLLALQLDKAPYIGPAIKALALASEIIGAVTDVIDFVDGFIPEFGSSLQIVVTHPDPDKDWQPVVVEEGETAKVEVYMPLKIWAALCTGDAQVGTSDLMTKIRDFFIKRVTKDVPVIGDLFDVPKEQLGWVQAKIVSAINKLVDTVLNIVGVGSLVDSLVAKICDWFAGDLENPNIPLDPAGLSATCGNLGSGGWTCTSDCVDTSVTISGSGPNCASNVEGSATVACRDCTPESCPDGCCTKYLECLPGLSKTKCGGGGIPCVECEDYEICNAQQECECISECTEVGKLCQGTEIIECKEVAPGCLKRLPVTDCAISQATCEEGACVGGCGPWNCPAEGDDPPDDGSPCCITPKGSTTLECGTCSIEEGGSAGDPHLRTHDGLLFDFQGHGEFVLVESTETGGGMIVQARQEPPPDPEEPLCAGVTLNSAVAAQVGDARVEVDKDDTLRVDGVPVVLAPSAYIDLAGGGYVARGSVEKTSYILGWPDGSEVRVSFRGYWLDVFTALAPARAGKVAGLLGDANGMPADDLRTRDGQTVLGRPAPWTALHEVVGESWRVQEAESLFDYPEGLGWADMQGPALPAVFASAAELPEEATGAAAEVCDAAGLEDPALYGACILDVVCVGSSEAAESLADMAPGELTLPLAFPLLFEGWGEEGNPAHGNWIVTEDGTGVQQTSNGDPAFFASPDEYLDVTIQGTIRIEDKSDDDFVGFAFGYQAPLAVNEDPFNQIDTLLLSWKQLDQEGSGGIFGPEGLSLARVSGTIEPLNEVLWAHDVSDASGYEVLASQLGPGTGWQHDTDHTFELEYRPDIVRVRIDGALIFEVSAADAGVEAFESGRFAFYNFSQAQVIYSDFFVGP